MLLRLRQLRSGRCLSYFRRRRSCPALAAAGAAASASRRRRSANNTAGRLPYQLQVNIRTKRSDVRTKRREEEDPKVDIPRASEQCRRPLLPVDTAQAVDLSARPVPPTPPRGVVQLYEPALAVPPPPLPAATDHTAALPVFAATTGASIPFWPWPPPLPAAAGVVQATPPAVARSAASEQRHNES